VLSVDGSAEAVNLVPDAVTDLRYQTSAMQLVNGKKFKEASEPLGLG
jgi:hypothetical protein